MRLSILSVLLCLTCCPTSGCEDGWFGNGCRYQCHCEENQCDSKGACKNGFRCLREWFGPACQFEDVTIFGSVLTTPKILTSNLTVDGNDETCYSSDLITSVSVAWNTSYHFSWLRIVVNETASLHEFNVQFTDSRNNATVQCSQLRKAVVNNRTIDLHCNLSVTVNSVVLSGTGIKYLCSLYISGGFNVALKQNTSQTTDYDRQMYAVNAVDGIRPSHSTEIKSCTHTAKEDRKPYWTLHFFKPQLVTRYVIYNRINCCFLRLKGFVLTSFDENQVEVLKFQDRLNTAALVYTIPSPVMPVSSVNISKIYTEKTEQYLTLCEVEAYVEPQCQPGRYGIECELKCNCRMKDEVCFFSTGGCPSGCPNGFTGEACSEECEHGKFGANCAEACSSRCLNGLCDRFSGLCNSGCISGYKPPHCTRSYMNEEDTTSTTVGVTFGIIVLIVLVLLGVFLWRCRQSNYKGLTKTRSKDNLELENFAPKSTESAFGGVPQGLSVQRSSLSNKQKDCNTSEDVTYESYYCNQEQRTTAICVEDLESFMLSNKDAFLKRQFEEIPNINKDATMNVALSARNKNKNRYKNICAYDHSRVTLTVNKLKNEGDYINASFVEGYKNEKFIASQAPTKVMVNDFIRMLWEYKVDKVVMLTNLAEDGKSKCEKYWPDDDNTVFGDIEVCLATTHVFADYTIRKLKLQKNGQTAHIFTHFHFTSWPDKGVPATPWPLVDFEQRVTSYPSHRPVVVHCSAGVGRTGTFIALCNVIREAEDTGQVDFFRTLAKLRTERVQMIQTCEQYIFLHKAAHMAMVCKGTTVSAEDITDRIIALEMTSTNGQTNMEKEFNGICSLTFDHTNGNEEVAKENLSPIYENASSSVKKQKDRFTNIVPKDIYRPVLRCESRGLSNYINAVLIPSFTKQNNQILTQLPLPTTIKDFWRLVMQHKVSLIVAFEVNAAATDSSIGDYLAAITENKQVCELFNIKTGPIIHENFWLKQDITIKCTPKKMSIRRLMHETLNVTHLKITSTDLEPDLLLSLVTQIRSYRSGDAWKTLYMCRNGAQFSGLACVLTLLLDRMDNDLHLTVPLVVGAIKLIRPEVIPTLEQYRTLYEVLQLYTANTNLYSNLGKSEMQPSSKITVSWNNHTRNDDFNMYSNA